jgi:glycosyltransferase involved in cell wall biosynthesis
MPRSEDMSPRRTAEAAHENAPAPSGSRWVILVSAVYPPEPVVSARETQDIAQELSRRNCRVTVICPQPSRPLGASFDFYRNLSGPHRACEDGIEVVRLPSFPAPQSRLVGRMRESFSFGYHACQYLRGLGESPDILSVNSWPLASQALLARHARAHRIPLVLQIKDVYPESLVAKLPWLLGGLAGPPLTRLDRWTARQAARVVVISENMRRTYVEGRQIPDNKVTTISSWQDELLFEDAPAREESCKRYGVPANRFTFLFLGNIGPVAGVDLLIRSFCEARLKGAQLLIAGGGSAREAAMDLSRKLGAKSVYFISDPDARNVPVLQSMADVCLLPMKRGSGMSSIPSKLPAYMFSAKPVLATVDSGSDTARAIQAANCGWVDQPECLTDLVARMRHVAQLPAAELGQIGERGRVYGLREFSKVSGVQRATDAILNVLPQHRTANIHSR